MFPNNQHFNESVTPAAAPEDEALFPPVDEEDAGDSAPKKRNSGRTGPTSSTGRAKSARNSTKHGGCALTLILPTESEEEWQSLLARWLNQYNNPAEDTLDYDFVLKTAQAEWHRLRCQQNFDGFLATTCGVNPFNWLADQVKKHDLLLRYKTSAERSFQREYRLLQQHLKSKPKPAAPAESESAPEPGPTVRAICVDSNSPTGYSCIREAPEREGVTYPYPVPAPTDPFPFHHRREPTSNP